MDEPLSDFLREYKVIPSNKFGTIASQNKAELYALPSGTSTKLWMLLAGQRSEMRHFSASIF
jgi:hypothetical protein